MTPIQGLHVVPCYMLGLRPHVGDVNATEALHGISDQSLSRIALEAHWATVGCVPLRCSSVARQQSTVDIAFKQRSIHRPLSPLPSIVDNVRIIRWKLGRQLL